METQARGRSPSGGHQGNQHIRTSPSPHPFNGQISSPENQFGNQAFANDLSPTSGNINYNLQNNYFNGQQYQYQNGINVNQQVPSPLEQSQFQSDMLNVDTRFGDFPHQQGFNKQEILLDPQLQGGLGDQAINPQDLVSNMSSPQNLAPTPPNYMRTQHSEPTSPYTSAPQNQSPNHSRQASLDPAAAYSNQQEWTMMQGPQFQGHRRTPSEYSDVSSSNAPSPYIAQGEGFDIGQNHSPLLNPQPDLYTDGLGIESVNISDPQQRQSPRHSPYVSPRISPQPGPGSAPEAPMLPETQMNYNGIMPEYPQLEQFPAVQQHQRLPSNDFGRADQYDVPQINVESVPTTQIDNTRSPTNIEALTPPDRG